MSAVRRAAAQVGPQVRRWLADTMTKAFAADAFIVAQTTPSTAFAAMATSGAHFAGDHVACAPASAIGVTMIDLR